MTLEKNLKIIENKKYSIPKYELEKFKVEVAKIN